MESTRPRLLLVPSISELEWEPVRPLLEEWADVALYDLPGIGTEGRGSGLDLDAIIGRGIEELERRGWPDAIVVGDQFGAAIAVLVARAWAKRVAGIALGHACLTYARDGERPAISTAVADFQLQLTQLGPAAGRQMLLQGLVATHGEEIAARIGERLPEDFAREYSELLLSHQDVDLEPELRALGAPLLLAEHRDCPLWTAEGFEDAVAAFPDARTVVTTENPGSSLQFAAALREFALAVAPRDRTQA